MTARRNDELVDLLSVDFVRIIDLGAWLGSAIEVGVWLPAIVGTTTAGSLTYDPQDGRYCRIGPLVHAWFDFAIASIVEAPTGNVQIAGLPYTVEDTINQSGSISRVLNLAVNVVDVTCAAVANTTRIQLQRMLAASANHANMPANNIQVASSFRGHVVYLAG